MVGAGSIKNIHQTGPAKIHGRIPVRSSVEVKCRSIHEVKQNDFVRISGPVSKMKEPVFYIEDMPSWHSLLQVLLHIHRNSLCVVQQCRHGTLVVLKRIVIQPLEELLQPTNHTGARPHEKETIAKTIRLESVRHQNVVLRMPGLPPWDQMWCWVSEQVNVKIQPNDIETQRQHLQWQKKLIEHRD